MAGVRLWLVDAFTDQPFHGNPAVVVVLEEPASPQWMAAVAREMHVSDTAFAVRDARTECDYELRWFTPELEVDLCGHATLAAAHCLLAEGAAEPLRFATRSGLLTVGRRGDGSLTMDFPASPASIADSAQLDAAGGALGAAVRWAGRTNDDFFLLVELDDERSVREAVPDLAAIAELDASAVIVTAVADRRHRHDFVSRVFAPKAGMPEDPVTGSSHTVLAPFWSERLGTTTLLGYQASHRPGWIEVELRDDRVVLAGRAVTVIDGFLTSTAAPT